MSKRIFKITGSWLSVEITYSPPVAIGILLLLTLLPVCCVAASSFTMKMLFLFLFCICLFCSYHILFKGLSITNTKFEKKKSVSESQKTQPNTENSSVTSVPRTTHKRALKREEPPMKKVPIPTEVAREANDSALDEWRDFMDPED